MAGPKDIIRYLRECYRENGSRGGIWNWFSASITNRIGIQGEDRLAMDAEGLGSHYLRQNAASAAADAAEVSRKEQDLVYATLFVVGWVERFDGKPEPVCAPLFVFPATSETATLEQGATLSIDLDGRQTHYPLLEVLGGIELARELEGAIDRTVIGEGCLGELRRCLAKAAPEADLTGLLDFPRLISQTELRKRFDAVKKNPNAPLSVVAASAVGLVKKSVEMRGVLNELDEMAKPETPLSAPVRALLGEPGVEPYTAVSRGKIPAILSQAQLNAIEASRDSAVTLVIGPPGTGKSFTIAALAIETMSRGFSSLIASKMNHAVDVVGDKIDQTLGLEGVVVRGGRHLYLKELKSFLTNLLSGVLAADAPTALDLAGPSVELRKKEKAVSRLTKRFEAEMKRERKSGELLARQSSNWLTRLRQQWARNRAEEAEPAWELAAKLEAAIDGLIDSTVEFLKLERASRLGEFVAKDRKALKNFSSAIRARTGSRQEEYFGKFKLWDVLRALPVWLVNVADINRVLPNRHQIFELAIVDESTQCDIASVLPILQRACRAVIVGDPKQLRHISFLPRARQAALADQFGLDEAQRERFDFRDVSLLDLASAEIEDQSQVTFLNEHFRSEPEIIGFSNREFYSGQLHVMTSCRDTHRDGGSALKLTAVDGVRGSNGVNPIEARAVFDAVAATAAAQADWPLESVQSIGIVSPFHDHTDELKRAFLEHPNHHEIRERHDLMIGTVHSFQGEERDLMFVTLAVDDDSPSASYRFLNRPDLFNVMITRARLTNQVFHSFSPNKVDPSSLLARFMAYARAAPTSEEFSGAPANARFDQFAHEVADALREAGAEVRIGYPLAGMKVDLVSTLDGRTRGVDLIGYPGAFADAFPIERVLVFRRAGLQIVPMPYAAWLVRREACLAWLTTRGGA